MTFNVPKSVCRLKLLHSDCFVPFRIRKSEFSCAATPSNNVKFTYPVLALFLLLLSEAYVAQSLLAPNLDPQVPHPSR